MSVGEEEGGASDGFECTNRDIRRRAAGQAIPESGLHAARRWVRMYCNCDWHAYVTHRSSLMGINRQLRDSAGANSWAAT